MKLAVKGILNYEGFYRRPSRCDIRVYRAGTEAEREADRLPVVIVTEREDNPGTSVTERIEVITTVLYHMLGQPAGGITIIEHYVDHAFVGGRATIKETFDLVTFTWTRCQGAIDPRWLPLTKEQVEEIIGEALPVRQNLAYPP